MWCTFTESATESGWIDCSSQKDTRESRHEAARGGGGKLNDSSGLGGVRVLIGSDRWASVTYRAADPGGGCTFPAHLSLSRSAGVHIGDQPMTRSQVSLPKNYSETRSLLRSPWQAVYGVIFCDLEIFMSVKNVGWNKKIQKVTDMRQTSAGWLLLIFISRPRCYLCPSRGHRQANQRARMYAGMGNPADVFLFMNDVVEVFK